MMIQKVNQIEAMNNKADVPEEEIELIDILRILWKWKYLIIGGSAVCAIIAMAISLMMPKVYQINMVLRPGILSITDKGQKLYIDTPENIKAIIDTGIFQDDILSNLRKTSLDNIPNELRIRATLIENSDTLKVSYESPQIEQGIEILNLTGRFLMEEYSKLVEYYKNEIERDLKIKRSEVQKFTSIKRSNEINIRNIEKRIYELETEIVLINENTASLDRERKKLLSKNKDESSILSALLYSNTIQQNLQLSNGYKDEINNLKLKKETELQQISGIDNELQRQLTEIDNLEFKKNNIQNVQIIHKPYSSPFPVKPKIILNITLAIVLGFFITILLSFFLEYLAQNRRRF